MATNLSHFVIISAGQFLTPGDIEGSNSEYAAG
jgi:hypothetical protein